MRFPARKLGDLTGRTAAITGASSGIGLACARVLLGAGATVHAAARTPEKIIEGVPEEALRRGLHTASLDVMNPASIAAWAGELPDDVDLLVLSAGLNITDRWLPELTAEGWDRVLRTNLDGVFHCVRALLPRIQERQGDIVLISSVAGAWPDHTGMAYQASKGGLTSFGRALAHEVHSKGVRVTTLAPGIVNTPILDKRPNPPKPELRRYFVEPDDIAQVVLLATSLPQRVNLPEISILPTYLNSLGYTHASSPTLPEDRVRG